MNLLSDGLHRSSSTIYCGDDDVKLRSAVLATPSLFRRCIETTLRKRKDQVEKLSLLRPSKTAVAPSMDISPHAVKCTMPLICMEVADLFDMNNSDEEIDSFMKDALKDEDDDKIDHPYFYRNANAEEASSHSLQALSTHPQAATSPSAHGTYSEDIDAAVGSQEKKLVATMKKSAASRAALKRFGSQSTKGAHHTHGAMIRSNATKNLLFRNARCSSKPKEMLSSKRQKAAKYTPDEASYDSIIAAACFIMGDSK